MNANNMYYSTQDWENGNIIIDGIKIPKLKKDTQVQLRHKRKIGFCKIAGRVYYSTNNILEYIERNKVEVAS